MQRADVKITEAIHFYLSWLQSVPEDKMNPKPSPARWSKKEIPCHPADDYVKHMKHYLHRVLEPESVPCP